MASETDSAQNPEWQRRLRRFKEQLAKRLWALSGVTEAEKETAFGGYLADLHDFERSVAEIFEETSTRARSSVDENELLRSLLGVTEDDLRARSVALAQDLAARTGELEHRSEEAESLRQRTSDVEQENEALRAKLREAESALRDDRLQRTKDREDDIRHFSQTNESLKAQLKDLESRLGNLRLLFTESNQQMVSSRQEEITLLQKKLLEEMESALRKKQEMLWAEEEMFAQGVARRVRTSLVSAQGQLILTLERLGLLDPESKSETVWKTRFRLFVEGAPQLATDFRAIHTQLQSLTALLDDYLHLTRRRPVAREAVSLKSAVQTEMADLLVDRRPTLAIEFLPDDPLPDVIGDGAMLRFVVRELVRNAVEALPNQAGKVVVSIKNRSDRNQVELVVRDSGPGVPPHLLPRLFEPFFSTKENRQGLSLSRARRYAEFHNGTLELLQSDAGGTTFSVTLPLNAAHQTEELPPGGLLASGTGGRT